MPTLLVFADSGIPMEWTEAFESLRLTVRTCRSENELRGLSQDAIGLTFVRLSSANGELPELLNRLGRYSGAPVILVQPRESQDLAAAARALGVADYLREPVTTADVIASVEGCLADRSSDKGARLRGAERLVGRSAAMSEVRRQIARIAASDCNVLITGDTGTGKELASELIHANSRRSGGRFVCVNCAAIPEALLESELFGYEKGAFTGAHNARPGQLELADGGTLFLDEIGELSLHAQAKILRAIEGKEVQRLGRRTSLTVDIRIVCATNRDLEANVKDGTFRADLFFRLNVARLQLPPLRERKEDIRDLAEHYLTALNARMGLRVTGFTEHSWRDLLLHDWPGNVRELKNIVEASLVRLAYPRMTLAELPEEFHRQFASGAVSAPTESEKLLAALVCHNWNKSKAAEELSWSRMTLYRKMAKYQMSSSQKVKAGAA
jgi:DNA-binding NtrC family response regulator